MDSYGGPGVVSQYGITGKILQDVPAIANVYLTVAVLVVV